MLARVRSTFEERSETEDFATRLLAWAGAYAILFVGGAHILICGEHFLVATYLGLAFVAQWFNIAGLLTLGFDGLFIALSLLALTPQGRAVVEMQQERIEQEAEQKRPLEQPLLGAPLRAPGPIEREM